MKQLEIKENLKSILNIPYSGNFDGEILTYADFSNI